MRAASRNEVVIMLVGIVFLTSACAHFLTRDVETDTAVEKAREISAVSSKDPSTDPSKGR
jgi:uridylate kinase